MNFFKRSKYYFLRAWVKSALQTYYHPISILNRKGLKEDGPFIVVTNHPNTLSDVVLTVSAGYRPIHLLANAGLFRSPQTAWFFRQVYCLPIQRRQDVKRTGTSNNRKNMNKVINHLNGGGAMYIAPEGSSWLEWHLRPLKTGVSRIAFQAAQNSEFKQSLKVIPVGFTYQDGARFRSGVVLEVGESIQVQNWHDSFLNSPKKAQKELVKEIEAHLKACMIHTDDQFQEILLRHLMEAHQHSTPLKHSAKYQHTKQILVKLKKWKERVPEQYEALIGQTQYIRGLLLSLGLQLGYFVKPTLSGKQKLQLLFTWPIALWGWLNHLLPWGIPIQINRIFNNDRTFASTYKIVTGLLSVPIFYGFQTLLFLLFLPLSWPWAFVYLFSLNPSGKYTNYYYWLWQRWKAARRIQKVNDSYALQEIRTYLLQLNVLLDQFEVSSVSSTGIEKTTS